MVMSAADDLAETIAIVHGPRFREAVEEMSRRLLPFASVDWRPGTEKPRKRKKHRRRKRE
jgi:hypothetical protein